MRGLGRLLFHGETGGHAEGGGDDRDEDSDGHVHWMPMVVVLFSSCAKSKDDGARATAEPISQRRCRSACSVASRSGCRDMSDLCKRGGIVQFEGHALHCAAAVMAACFEDDSTQGRCVDLCFYGRDGQGAEQEEQPH
jgi:hypothetical protein